MSVHAIEEGLPHNMTHTICLHCKKTEISVWPVGTKMSLLECGQCGKVGGCIPSADPMYFTGDDS